MTKNTSNINSYDDKKRVERIFLNSVETKNTLYLEALLLSNPEIKNCQNDNGNTALMLAVKNNNSDIIQLLINNNVDCNIRNNDGNNALMLAVKNDNSDIIQLLINNNVDCNIRNNDGNTALMLAVKNDNLDTVKKLLAAGSNPNIPNYKPTYTNKHRTQGCEDPASGRSLVFETTYYHAAIKANEEIFKALVKEGREQQLYNEEEMHYGMKVEEILSMAIKRKNGISYTTPTYETKNYRLPTFETNHYTTLEENYQNPNSEPQDNLPHTTETDDKNNLPRPSKSILKIKSIEQTKLKTKKKVSFII